MSSMNGKSQSDEKQSRECLLRQGNSEANSGLASLEGRQLDWEASTLPLSYTRSWIKWLFIASLSHSGHQGQALRQSQTTITPWIDLWGIRAL